MNDYYAVINHFMIFIMILVRISGFFVTVPIFSGRNIPRQVKIGLIVILATLVLPVLTLKEIPPLPNDVWGYAFIVFKEFILGLIMGFVASLIFMAVQMTGFFLDTQIGFGVVNIMDPLQGQQLPLVGNFLYILSIFVFLILNGHHVLITLLVYSFKLIPIGMVAIKTSIAGEIAKLSTDLFIVTLKISLPVLVSLMLIDLALGILSKFMPQLNIFVVGIPIKLFVGVFMLALMLPAYVHFLEVMFNETYKELGKILEFCH